MSPDDFTAFETTRKFPVCTTSLCFSIFINDDTILEKNEFFKVIVMVEHQENITLHQSDVFVLVMDNEKGRTQNLLSNNYYTPFLECTKYKHWLSIFAGNTSVQLQTISIRVFENVEKDDGLLCAIFPTTNSYMDCVVGFHFEVIVSLNSSTEGR